MKLFYDLLSMIKFIKKLFMKSKLIVILLLSCISVYAQDRDYFSEAEAAFNKLEYSKASELYRAAYVVNGINTDFKRKVSNDCAQAQRNAREQRSLGNNIDAKVWYDYILELNPNDSEASKFVSVFKQSTYHNGVSNIDKFPIIYTMRNTIECDGIYKGPHWKNAYRNHTKKFHQELSKKFNPKAFFVECSFLCLNAVPVDNYYEDLVLLSFDTGYRSFGIFLSRNQNIIIYTNYGDYKYETKCQYSFGKWNTFQVSYNHGKVKIKCNDMSDEFDVTMREEGWTDNVISTTYWGTMNTFKGQIRNIAVGAETKEL